MTSSNKKLRIAIAGYGFGKNVHYPAFIDSADFKVVSFFHPNEEKKQLIEKETGLNCSTNWSDLISREDIDGIVIATPPEYRFKYAKEALLKGKHLLLEKPVCLNAYEIEELQRISLSKNLCVGVNFEYRVVPLFLQAKEIIEEELLGTPFLIKLDWLMSSRTDPNRIWNWYSSSKKGGGVIGALGTHAFDMLHWFFGDSDKITGQISTSIKKRPIDKGGKSEEVTSEDVCIANICIKNGSNIHLPCQLSLSSVSKGGRGFSLEIYGSKGSLFLKSDNQKDYVHGFSLKYVDNLSKINSINAKDKYLFEKTWSDGRIAPIKRIHSIWGNCIKSKVPMIPGLNEGLRSQKISEAIIKSSQSGIEVKI